MPNFTYNILELSVVSQISLQDNFSRFLPHFKEVWRWHYTGHAVSQIALEINDITFEHLIVCHVRK